MMRSIYATFDGACEPYNPGGHMGQGGVITIDGEHFCDLMDAQPAEPGNTNNVSEYKALAMVLAKLVEMNVNGDDDEVIIAGDSQLVVRQMTGRYRVNADKAYFPHYMKCMELASNLGEVHLQWINRDRNKAADALSRKALEGLELEAWTDETPCPLGKKYRGRPLGEVPTSYLKWWVESFGTDTLIKDYLASRKDA